MSLYGQNNPCIVLIYALVITGAAAMDKGLFLYNPKSGDQSIKNKIDNIIKKFQKSDIFLVPFRMFDAMDDDKTLKKLLESEKFSFIILSGGDGSLNYLVNFLMKTASIYLWAFSLRDMQ